MQPRVQVRSAAATQRQHEGTGRAAHGLHVATQHTWLSRHSSSKLMSAQPSALCCCTQACRGNTGLVCGVGVHSNDVRLVGNLEHICWAVDCAPAADVLPSAAAYPTVHRASRSSVLSSPPGGACRAPPLPPGSSQSGSRAPRSACRMHGKLLPTASCAVVPHV